MGIKIVQMNKGPSEFFNKIPHIKTVILLQKPDILVINEANLSIYDNISQHQFPGFKMEIDQLGKISKRSRTVILVKENVSYKRCMNLESKMNSVIWLHIVDKNKSKFY